MRKRSVIGILLLGFCIACRSFTLVADFYAERLYPVLSGALSWLGSFTSYSLEEIAVLAFAVSFVVILVKAVRHKEGFLSWLRKTAMVLVWLLVWIYMGWGNNYYRTSLYARKGILPAAYDEEVFKGFLEEYSQEINAAADVDGDYDPQALEEEIRAFYEHEVTAYGYTKIRKWQHVKRPLFNRLFSAVRVQGYMGPFFCESQVNGEVLGNEYPYVAAHEMAHLAGVTSEAEASWWGFACCRKSESAAVRYSAYLSVLPYVLSNAAALLSEEEFSAWTATLCEKAKADYTGSQTYWRGKRIGWLDKAQNWFFSLYLRSNGVSEGIKDYYGVVSIIMTMDNEVL